MESKHFLTLLDIPKEEIKKLIHRAIELKKMTKENIIKAWKSHDTLYRQSGDKFSSIISEISKILKKEAYMVPYTTRIWYCKIV